MKPIIFKGWGVKNSEWKMGWGLFCLTGPGEYCAVMLSPKSHPQNK